MFFGAVIAQDNCFDRLEQKTIEVTQLKQEKDSIVSALVKNHKEVLDSLRKENETLSKQLADTNKVLLSLRKDIGNQQKLMSNFDIDKAKFEKERKEFNNEKKQLKQDVETALNKVVERDSKIKQLETENTMINNEKREQYTERFNKGKIEILDQIRNKYHGKSFDELIVKSNFENVTFDIQLLSGNKAQPLQVMNDLKTYFEAKKQLAKKYNSLEVDKALNSLKNVEQTGKVKELILTLESYKSISDELTKAIEGIIDLDNRKSVYGQPKEILLKKYEEITGQFSLLYLEISKNNLSLSDFPYIIEVVDEILAVKRKGLDTDMSDFLEKVK